FGTRFDFSVFPILFVMKKIFLLFFSLSATLGMAQHFDYASHWKEIEQQEKEQGKLKSLLPEVDAIYEQTKKDNEIQQRIKALLYQSKIALATTDDDDVEINTVNNFREELQNAKPIEKAVLQSMLAEIYANYYQTN